MPSDAFPAEFRSGGCLCGAVRWRAAWPPLVQATCSCRNCQKQAGSALSVVLVFARDALACEGDLSTYVDRGLSGQEVRRRFCPTCGSPVLTETPAAEAQGLVFVKGGTIDDPTDLDPDLHYWQDSAQPWMVWPDHGRRLARQDVD